jgi:hypothetical protein
MVDWKIPQRTTPPPPGEHPFRVKGHGLLARMATYDKLVPGGRQAVVGAIADRAVREYLSQMILAVGWYDLFAHVELDLAAADLLRLPPNVSVANASRVQAQSDAKGIYSVLLKVVSPQMLVKKMGTISAQYFDHGTVDVVRLESKAARMTRTGIVNQHYWWWGSILEGYVRALFGIAGARGLRIHCGELVTERPDDPLGHGRFSCDVRWD